MIKGKARTTIIRTGNREIYEQFSNLHFTDKVILEKSNSKQLGKILKNFNLNGKVLEKEHIGDKIIIRKKKNLNFNIYLR